MRQQRVSASQVAAPRPRGDPATLLLQIESEARRASTEKELLYLFANETRRLLSFRQSFVFRRSGSGYRVIGVSSLASVDRTAPVIRWIEKTVRQMVREHPSGEPVEFEARAYTEKGDTDGEGYAFPYFLWVPIKARDGHIFAGALFASNKPWREANVVIGKRLGESFGHAWAALVGLRRIAVRSFPIKKTVMLVLLAAMVAAGFVHVPLTTLAPVEVVGKEPLVVASPIDGIVREILVSPNARVTAGDPMVEFENTDLSSRFEIADRQVVVAEARLRRAEQGAFGDPKSARELAVSRAELDLAIAERNFAAVKLEKAVIRAERDGIAIYSDKRDWVGRPVSVGEQIMQIADADQIELSIDLAVDDSIVLKNGARVKVFLDSDPLNPKEAVLTRASYHAKPDEAGTLSYTVASEFTDETAQYRIGSRGAAQIFGAEVPLYFFLFRRPIAWIRQNLGL